MADIFSLGLNAATGGVFGIIGTVLGRVAGYFEKQLSFKQEQARWLHEYELHELQMQARQQETELELALAAQAGSWKGLEASITAEAAIGRASQWGDKPFAPREACLNAFLMSDYGLDIPCHPERRDRRGGCFRRFRSYALVVWRPSA